MSTPSVDAQNDRPDSTSSRRVRARGTFRDTLGREGTFEGTYTLQTFVQQYDQLAAAGAMAGRLCAPDGFELGMTSRRVTLAVLAAATNEGVVVEIGPVDVNLAGLMAHIEPVTLHLLPHPMWGGLCDTLMAAISPDLNRPIAGERVVALLNALLSILDPPRDTADPNPALSKARKRSDVEDIFGTTPAGRPMHEMRRTDNG